MLATLETRPGAFAGRACRWLKKESSKNEEHREPAHLGKGELVALSVR